MDNVKLSARDIKKMTGAASRMQGESILYKQLEARRWHLGERELTVAGYDRRKDLVHFTCTWAAEGGGVGHRRVGMPLKAAIENQSGLVDDYVVLH